MTPAQQERKNFVRSVYKKVNEEKERLKKRAIALNKYENELLNKEEQLNYVLANTRKQREERIAVLKKEKVEVQKLQVQSKEEKAKYVDLVARSKSKLEKLQKEFQLLDTKEFKVTQERKKIEEITKRNDKLLKQIASNREKVEEKIGELKGEQKEIDERKKKLALQKEKLKEEEKTVKTEKEQAITKLKKARSIQTYWEKRAKEVERLEKDLNHVIRQRQLRGELNDWRKKNK